MDIKKMGRQTWVFANAPTILSHASVVGKLEGDGPLSGSFDYVFADVYAGEKTFEKAEQKMQQKAADIAVAKAGITNDDIDLFCAGDLLNQNTPSAFTARQLGTPFLGLFNACATIAEALSVASLAVASGAANNALALAGSHTCAAERQFRYPNEYGCQKPPSSQFTASAAGAAVLAAQGGQIKISSVTIGKVIDLGVCDPFNMGAAMAPAFVDTVCAHLRELKRNVADYDLILSGDLGKVGRQIALDLLSLSGISDVEQRCADCGRMLFGDDERFFAGGSGCGCAASVGLGHICELLEGGEFHRVLLCATGALLSPCANMQRESIPSISHAVVLERG